MTDELRDATGDALRSIALSLPKLVAFLLILVIGLFIAKAIGKAVDKVLERVGFDRAVERGGIKKALAQSTYDASDIVGRLVHYTLLLFVLQMVFGVFGPNPISDLITNVIAFLPKIIVAIIIVVVAAAIATAARELLANTLGGLSYGRTLANIAAFFIIGLGVIAASSPCRTAGRATTPRQERELPRVKAEAGSAPSVREQAAQAQRQVSGQSSTTSTQVFDQGTGTRGSTATER